MKLHPADILVYDYLIEKSARRPSEIAIDLNKSRQNISRSLKKLRMKGMVEEFRLEDRRKTLYVANEKYLNLQ